MMGRSCFRVVVILVITMLPEVFSSTSSSSSSLKATFASIGDHRGKVYGGRQKQAWPCCNRCGGCTKSIPPQCQCQDLVKSCHPSCKLCLQSPLSVDPPMFHCMDRIPNYCLRRCTATPTSSSSSAAAEFSDVDPTIRS